MTIWPDEYLHYWADVYVARGIDGYCTLDAFLLDPHGTLARIDGGEFRPLLPAQQRAADEVSRHEARLARIGRGVGTVDDEIEIEGIVAAARGIEQWPRRNGRAVEPMHHHRHPGSRLGAMFRPKGA